MLYIVSILVIGIVPALYAYQTNYLDGDEAIASGILWTVVACLVFIILSALTPVTSERVVNVEKAEISAVNGGTIYLIKENGQTTEIDTELAKFDYTKNKKVNIVTKYNTHMWIFEDMVKSEELLIRK